MRHGLLSFAVIVVMVCAAAAIAGDTKVEINGQVRVRTEVDAKSTHPDITTRHYTDLRTRVGVKATPSENAHAFVQLQDSRRLGSGDNSGTLANSMNVDVHQAYVQIEQLFNGGPGLKAGRFEVVLGGQRVFGSVGWHNVGRSWDGLNAWFDQPEFRLDGFWLKRREVNSTAYNRDSDIFGVNAKIKKAGVEAFAFYETDADETVDDTLITGYDALTRVSLGLYGKRTYEQFDFEVNAVYQTGNSRKQIDSVTYGEDDIAAMMFAFEAGMTLDPDTKARVAAAIDYTSGDKDGTDNDYKAYNNLYYTGHKFRGFMDYFVGSPANGLVDLILRGKFAPVEGWLFKGDIHYFKTAQEYAVDANTNSKNVGIELDFGVSTSKIAGINWASGVSVFLPDDDWAGADAETGMWLYSMATLNFK